MRKGKNKNAARIFIVAAVAAICLGGAIAIGLGSTTASAATATTDVKKAADGNWYYYAGGKVSKVDTVAKNKNGWWVIQNGKVNFKYTGFAKNSNGWWYCKNGKVQFGTNSVIKGTVNGQSGWWYVKGGKVQISYTGVADYKNANGWWYVKKGKVDFSANTVAKNKNGWWYVLGGKVQFGFTGLANYSNANGWWYIKNGKVDFTHNGVDKNKNGWWYVQNGKVDFSYTGFGENANGWWYIKDGKVQFGQNGNVVGTIEGIYKAWTVINGRVDMRTVRGVTFDLSHFPTTLSLGNDDNLLAVLPMSTINPADITYVIDDGKAQLIYDDTAYNLLYSDTELYQHGYCVSSWDNMIANVETYYEPQMFYPYRCEISTGLKTRSFNVAVYYRGSLLRTCAVNIKNTSSNTEYWRKWIDEIEENAWTSDMTNVEKLHAVEKYVKKNYTYTTDQVWCNSGAALLLFAARDLGLTARYRFVGPNYDYSAGYGDQYNYMGMYACGGHVCTVVTIDGEDWIFETQGHAG